MKALNGSGLKTVGVEHRIVEARGQKVILDVDLATLYGVETRTLNQAMKRNAERFPPDFAFQWTLEEVHDLVRSRSQSVTLKRGENVKYRPWAFTEHGALMAPTILNSPRAVDMSVYVVRAFVRLRDLVRTHTELAKELAILERRVTGHDEDLKVVFMALRKLLAPPADPKREIRFGSKRQR